MLFTCQSLNLGAFTNIWFVGAPAPMCCAVGVLTKKVTLIIGYRLMAYEVNKIRNEDLKCPYCQVLTGVIFSRYCTISPFMIIWGLVFFLFAYWVYKHQLIYVYKLKKDTNSWQFWPKIYSLFHIGLYIGQVVPVIFSMTGHFHLKRSSFKAGLLFLKTSILVQNEAV